MKIRKLKQNEIKYAAKIIGENYSQKYEKTSFKEMEAMFKNYVYNPQYIVAEEKGEIIGVTGWVQSWMDYNIYQIFWVNVKKEYQGNGIGTALVQKVITNIKKIKNAQLILLTTTAPKFYEQKFNFKPLKLKSGKYGLMGLELRK